MRRDDKQAFKCCICGKIFVGVWGNNPYPVVDEEGAQCCDECNFNEVIPARILAVTKKGLNDGK